MPELPEVETTCRGLAPHLEGRRIEKVVLRRPDLRIPFPPRFIEALEGTQIVKVRRRAKYALFDLDAEQTVIVHLGMSGRMLIVPNADSYEPLKHDHVLMHLPENRMLVFHDPRRFGLMTLCDADVLESHKLIRHLGPEPLSDDFNSDYLAAALSKRSVPIKQAIMDQKIVVGVGNIYACEALHRVHCSPFAPAKDCMAKVPKLVEAIKEVLQEAIASGGSTLRDFVRSDGGSGYFQHHFAVYDREGEPCSTCGSTVLRKVQSGRSTFYCAECQFSEN